MWVEFYSVYELCDLHVVRKTLVLWNLVAIIVVINALALVASALINVFLYLLVKQLQLTIFVHTRSEHALLARSERDVDFIWRIISSNQMKMHRSLYINAVLIQSREQVIFMTCTQCAWSNDLRSFLKCRFISIFSLINHIDSLRIQALSLNPRHRTSVFLCLFAFFAFYSFVSSFSEFAMRRYTSLCFSNAVYCWR